MQSYVSQQALPLSIAICNQVYVCWPKYLNQSVHLVLRDHPPAHIPIHKARLEAIQQLIISAKATERLQLITSACDIISPYWIGYHLAEHIAMLNILASDTLLCSQLR